LPKLKIAIIDNPIYPEIYKTVAHWSTFLGDAAWTSFHAPDRILPEWTRSSSSLSSLASCFSRPKTNWVQKLWEIMGTQSKFPISGLQAP
jgi:hypothetical protein